METDLDNWPTQGRVGYATAGDFRLTHVFVFPEVGGRWGFYTSDGVDDVLPSASFLLSRLEEAKVRWLEPEDDLIVERAIFAMRPLTGLFDPAATKRKLSRWGRA